VDTVRARKAAARRSRRSHGGPDRQREEVSVPPRTEGQSTAGRVSAISPPAKENDPHAGAPRAPRGARPAADRATPPAPEAAPPSWSDADVISALRQCLQLLAPMTASIDILDPLRNGECGAPVPIRLKRIGVTGGVDVDPPAVVNCQLITRLHDWIEGTL